MEMPVPITALYAAIQAVISIVLGFGVGPMRGKLGISVGDGGNPDLLLAMRKHGNWTEHVPFALLLLALLELNGGGVILLHGLGAGLVVARIAHPLGLKKDTVSHPLRIIGAAGTILVTLITAVALLLKAL